MKIKKKKMFKSKHFFCSFLSKNGWSLFEKVKKHLYFVTNIFQVENVIFQRFWLKDWDGWSHII